MMQKPQYIGDMRQAITDSIQRLVETYWAAMFETRNILGREDFDPEMPDWAWTILEPHHRLAEREAFFMDRHSLRWQTAMQRAYHEAKSQDRSTYPALQF